jgi:hypothetical protein
MAEVTFLYAELPVKLSSEEFEELTGIALNNELDGDSTVKESKFLDLVHSLVYDYVLYQTKPKSIVNRIIAKYAGVQKDIKKMLVVQTQFLLEQNGVQFFNGLIVKTATNSENFDITEISSKLVAPMVYQIAMATEPNLLYVG